MMPNKRLLSLVPEAKKYIFGKVGLSWLSLLAGILLWFTFGGLLQGVLEEKPLSPAPFVLLLLCLCLRFFAARYTARLTHLASACVKTRMRSMIYEKVRALGPGPHPTFPTGEIVQLAGEGVEQLESYFGNYLPQFFYAALAPLTLLVVFLPYSPATGIVLFLCVPLIPVAIAKVQRFAKRMLGDYWEAYAGLSDSFLENLQGLTTLKVYGADEERHRQMNKEAEHFRRVTMKVLTMQLNSVTIMDFVAYGGSALGCLLTARAFRGGNLPFSAAFAMVMLSAEFFLAMRALGSYFHTAMNGVAASERMFRLLDEEEPQGGELVPSPGDLVLKDLSFAYAERTDRKEKEAGENPKKEEEIEEKAEKKTGEGKDEKKERKEKKTGQNVLQNLSLTIPRGSFFAVVGESGSGKSTLARLLSGSLRGYEGSLTLGGTELRDASPEALRSLLTVVPYGSCLFAGTVRDLLRMGKEDASDEEMTGALKKVSLWDYLKEQGGLDFVLQERGANLSGGQRQRLAIARALLKDSPLYLFDEATSNIDSISEEAILSAVHAMRGSHTVILISHRLGNVVSADGILYLENGGGAELGTHEELLAKNGGYAALYKAQQALEQLGRGKEQ